MMLPGGGENMERWRTAIVAALAAMLPVLASGLHGWVHALFAAAIGAVAVAALPSKKFSVTSKR